MSMTVPWLFLILLANIIPPPWAATPTRKPGGKGTSPTRTPGGENIRGGGVRRGRTVEEGVGCQDLATNGADYIGTANTTIGGFQP